MKIAIFSECYLPWTNGVVTSIVTLRKMLEKMGHTVYIFAPGKPHKEDDPFVYRLPELPFPSHPYRFARPYPRLPFDFAALDIDIIHVQHPFSVGSLGVDLAEKHGIPVVYTVHALYDNLAEFFKSTTLRKVGPAVMRNKMRRFCAKVDYVIAPSEFTREQLLADRVQSRIVVVPSGVDTIVANVGVREEIRKRLRIRQDDRVILVTGRISPEKRLDVFLRAIAVLQSIASPEMSDRIQVIIVGDGPVKRDMIQLAQDLGIQNCVHFVGKKPHKEIGDWYAAADIFAHSSPVETQGLVFVEAMSMGLPCVSTNIGGPKEIVKNTFTGFQVPLDAGAFAHAMHALVKSPELCREFGARGVAEAQKYTPEAMVSGVMRVYEAAIFGADRLNGPRQKDYVTTL